MTTINIRALALAVLMAVTAVIAWSARSAQKVKMADIGPSFDLQATIPLSFSEWREEAQAPALIINPQQKELLEAIYSQTLSRSYRNAQGYRIMLSIAYRARDCPDSSTS